MMQPEEMRKRLKNGEDPLKLSIEKWGSLKQGKGTDLAELNCALCEVYQNHTPYDDKCKKCPIYIKTKVKYCEGTPYKEYTKLESDYYMLPTHSPKKGAITKQRLAKAQEMYDFLVSLQITDLTRTGDE